MKKNEPYLIECCECVMGFRVRCGRSVNLIYRSFTYVERMDLGERGFRMVLFDHIRSQTTLIDDKLEVEYER
jgi:hypothetical protein